MKVVRDFWVVSPPFFYNLLRVICPTCQISYILPFRNNYFLPRIQPVWYNLGLWLFCRYSCLTRRYFYMKLILTPTNISPIIRVVISKDYYLTIIRPFISSSKFNYTRFNPSVDWYRSFFLTRLKNIFPCVVFNLQLWL